MGKIVHFDFCNYGKIGCFCLKRALPWMFRIRNSVFFCFIIFLLPGEGIGESSSLSSLPDPHYSDELPPYISPLIEKVRHIIYPVLGLPAIVVSGEGLTAVVSFDDGGKTLDWEMKIATHQIVSQSYALADVESAFDVSSGHYTLTGIVPHQAPRDIFNLVITSKSSSISDSQPNAVRVINEMKRDYRFVHLTDLHVGDPRGYLVPLSDENRNTNVLNCGLHIFNELSFFDPDFILFSG
ncbi:MAG: hypothetical protein JRI87_10360, partial [Deltaproteobacteria bacterium]|nr:hypothetical protein [Deltaproteobacteria bacterium]